MSLWLPVTSLICTVQGGEVHATVPLRKPTKRRTWDTLCGRRRALVLVQETVARKGGPVTGHMALRWPIKVRDAKADGRTRCRACFELNPSGRYAR